MFNFRHPRWPWVREVVMSPPPDKIVLCPDCGGNVEVIVLHKRKSDHFGVWPCGDTPEIDKIYEVIGMPKEEL